MASLTLPSLQSLLLQKSHFLGEPSIANSPHKSTSRILKTIPSGFCLKAAAKFNFTEILGGRGLCNGEEGLQQELKRTIEAPPSPPVTDTDDMSVTDYARSVTENDNSTSSSEFTQVSEDAFEKELLGLTGGFPGGEQGLQRFIEKIPPPKKTNSGASSEKSVSTKAKPPELPVLMPGMIAIVKNPSNPFYRYCGIIQRITDGKAGVLFEGGNWDKLITFRLEELERRDKGPPMVNPKSAVLEDLVQKQP